ncbi:YmiA family putative membrane protein [Erwinia mallotivora]
MDVNLSARQTHSHFFKNICRVNIKRRAWLAVFLFSGFFWVTLASFLITG